MLQVIQQTTINDIQTTKDLYTNITASAKQNE